MSSGAETNPYNPYTQKHTHQRYAHTQALYGHAKQSKTALHTHTHTDTPNTQAQGQPS